MSENRWEKHKTAAVVYQNVLTDLIEVSKARNLSSVFDSNHHDLERRKVDSLPTGNFPGAIRRISYMVFANWTVLNHGNGF